MFSEKPGNTSVVEHDVLTGAHRPIASSQYMMPEKWKGPVQKELEDLLNQGIIVPSTSPWASPVVPVQKPDGTVRLCIDYRKLNTITQPDPYYHPSIQEVVDKLGDSIFLSKLDLAKGSTSLSLLKKDVKDQPL